MEPVSALKKLLGVDGVNRGKVTLIQDGNAFCATSEGMQGPFRSLDNLKVGDDVLIRFDNIEYLRETGVDVPVYYL